MPKYSEFGRELKNAGCYFQKELNGHELWYSPITDDTFLMSRHHNEEVKKGMEMFIRKKAGVPKKR